MLVGVAAPWVVFCSLSEQCVWQGGEEGEVVDDGALC